MMRLNKCTLGKQL